MTRRFLSAAPAAVAAVLLTLPAPAELTAQDTEWNRYTLEDLGGVFVRFDVAESCEAVGVTPSEYEADVSMKLMESEVGVLTRDEMLERPALPELRVTLDCADGSGAGDAMAYGVELRVQQSAQMLRDTQITLPEAVTWYTTEIGVTSSEQAASDVGQALMGEVDAFIAAWTAIHAEEEPGS